MTDKIGRVDFEGLKLTGPQKEIQAGKLHFVQLTEEDYTLLTKNNCPIAKQLEFQLSIKKRTNTKDTKDTKDTKNDNVTGHHLFAQGNGEIPFYVSAIPQNRYSKLEFECDSSDKAPSINSGFVWYKGENGDDIVLEIEGTSYTGKRTSSMAGKKIEKIYLRCSGKGSAFDNFVLEYEELNTKVAQPKVNPQA